MPLAQRGRRADAVLKPGAALTLQVDRAAEEVGLACLERLADEIGFRIHLITDAVRGQIIALGKSAHRQVVFAHLDAVDGTIKVGGLGNDLEAGRIRLANDGNWCGGSSTVESACSTTARHSSISDCMCAAWCCSAWNEPISTPNCSRSFK